MICTHFACRCARAAELAEVADRTGNPAYLAMALEAYGASVPCRAAPQGALYQPTNGNKESCSLCTQRV